MLSRSSVRPMPLADRPDWDIFCAVIDNFGDIGICWRLARQLAVEHDFCVRLWVDDLLSLRPLCPQIDPQRTTQQIFGVEVRRWDAAFPAVIPGQIIVEAFGCDIPERFVAAMAQSQPPPVWINLEYLSAEYWVAGCHALPSPHPRLPLTKFFFFPGFTPETGGLLREKDLLARRRDFESSPRHHEEFWHELGFSPPHSDALSISLFSYENPAITDLLHSWKEGATPVCCLVPVSRSLPVVEAFCEQALRSGNSVRCGELEIRVLPFVEQHRYDSLLWSCDLNFVRGEDSFVRAQWAARPMVWQIYPQQEDAHLIKLDAFLDRYCLNLPEVTAAIVRKFWHSWNAGKIMDRQWHELAAKLPALRAHAIRWEKQLAEQEDLSSALVRFCRTKL